jgi:2-dehydro-3-deoxygalactonokinase
VLRTHSVLRHSMPGDLVGGDTEDGIAAGLDAGIAEPGRLTSSLFRTRAAALLSGKSTHWCAGYLSGLLVGAEVAGHKDRIKGAMIPLVGSERLCRLYASALRRVGQKTETIDATAATLSGLAAAREQLQ